MIYRNFFNSLLELMSSSDAEPLNIRAFNWLTLTILSDLYGSFPEPKNIESLHFVVETLVDIGVKAKEAEYLSYFSATMRWLKEEGFLRYESDDSGDFREVILTLRGLTVLGYLPTSLSLTDKKEPLIVKVRRILAKGSESAASKGIGTLLVKAFGMMVS